MALPVDKRVMHLRRLAQHLEASLPPPELVGSANQRSTGLIQAL
jgi:hypothetical protein